MKEPLSSCGEHRFVGKETGPRIETDRNPLWLSEIQSKTQNVFDLWNILWSN